MSEKKIIHVGIGFATGRKGFLKVLKTYIYSWKDSGLIDTVHIHLHVFIAYDLRYNDTKPSDYTRIGKELTDKVEGIHFVDTTYIQGEVDTLIAKGVLNHSEADLFFTSGYAAMRNAVLYAAMQQKMDYLLFLDDDEYPLAVTKDKNVALWSGQQVLSTHLQHIKAADITNGHHCGYISPIPVISFDDTLSEADFKVFIEAISNDIINWKSMQRVMRQGGVTYADTAILIQNTAEDVPEVNGCKFISGSNLMINLTDATRVFPFYNPPGARGEDTFLSTCLTERKVLRIPTYAFHNGFSLYNSLLYGVLPTELKPIKAESKAVVTRFYNACLGWVRYKPLLIYITQRDQYARKIQSMKEKLTITLPKLASYFRLRDFNKIMAELLLYDRNVETHYSEFMQTQKVWQSIVAHIFKEDAPL